MSNHVNVIISKGSYRGNPVTGTYRMIKPWSGEEGSLGFVTIVNPNPAKGTPPQQRVRCMQSDIEMVNADGSPYIPPLAVVEGSPDQQESQYELELHSLETEEEAMKRIADAFAMQDMMTDACAKGVIRGIVISGPPGIGKSFGVEKQLEIANRPRTARGEDPLYKFVTGGVSPIGLYQLLYHNRKPKHVIVFDDCDGVLFEEESLSLLKGALNSGDKRRLAWNKESRVLEEEDIPRSFEFEGSAMFLSNIDFERTIAHGSRISDHLKAIMSRCHYLDLEIGSVRDRLLRIKQIIAAGMLSEYEFNKAEEKMIVDFIVDNQQYMRELSLRMVKKIADFVAVDKKRWYAMAESTCLTREAKFKRLVEQKRKAMAAKGVTLR